MKVNISEIKVGKRVRIDLGELSSLEKSISSFGLLNPIIINQDKELIAGARRLSACRNIGLVEIDVHIIKTKDALTKLILEGEENLLRKDFSHSEINRLAKLKKRFLRNIYRSFKIFIKELFLSFIGLFRSSSR